MSKPTPPSPQFQPPPQGAPDRPRPADPSEVLLKQVLEMMASIDERLRSLEERSEKLDTLVDQVDQIAQDVDEIAHAILEDPEWDDDAADVPPEP